MYILTTSGATSQRTHFVCIWKTGLMWCREVTDVRCQGPTKHMYFVVKHRVSERAGGIYSYGWASNGPYNPATR